MKKIVREEVRAYSEYFQAYEEIVMMCDSDEVAKLEARLEEALALAKDLIKTPRTLQNKFKFAARYQELTK